MPQTIQHINRNVSFLKGLTFKNERGVPLIADKENNTLTFNAGMSDQQAIYAYEDTTVVGKLDVQAYSYKDVKVHLVRVNNTKTLDLGKIEKGVNDIWQQAVVRYTFDELDPITIDYANKEHFVHGGKGTFQNYNTDQKTAIRALPKTADDNDYYLFFVDCYDRLDTAGMKSNEPVSGYMPVGRHYGFIYNEFNNTRTIAHELGHGVNVLHHTFSKESESFYTTHKTDNLMDYNGGTTLNHLQWQWAHDPHGREWFGEEEEGEIAIETFSENDENFIGANDILQHLINNRSEIIELVNRNFSDKEIDKYAASQIITEYFYNNGVDVIIQNPNEAYNYLLQIFALDIYDKKEILFEDFNSDVSDVYVKEIIEKICPWISLIKETSKIFVEIAQGLYVERVVRDLNVDELYNELIKKINMSDNLNTKSAVMSKLSNSQFKDILDKEGVSNKEKQRLVNLKKYNAKALAIDDNFRNLLSKIKNETYNKYLKGKNPVFITSVANISEVNMQKFTSNAKLKNFSNAFTLLDIAIAMKTIADGDASPKDLLSIIPGASILLDQMMEYASPKEEDFKAMSWSNIVEKVEEQKLSISDINHNKGMIFVQYTTECQKYNKNIQSTTFIFKTPKDLVNNLGFKFTPKYINYSYFPDYSQAQNISEFMKQTGQTFVR